MDKKKAGKGPHPQPINHKLAVGASVCAGLLASNFGAVAIFKLTGSMTAAKIAAPSLAVLGGVKYYDWITDNSRKKGAKK